jgi:ADP-ribose pyrophosphatase
MDREFRVEKSESIYNGRIINLKLDTIKSPEGRMMQREIVEHPGAVGIIAVNDKNKLVLVRQYRHAIKKNLLEIPAGLLDNQGESPEACAIRELKEETGYLTESARKIAEFYTTAGFSNEKFYLFHADSIKPGVHQREYDEEGMDVEEIDVENALKMVLDGEIEDAKTIIAILCLTTAKCYAFQGSLAEHKNTPAKNIRQNK